MTFQLSACPAYLLQTLHPKVETLNIGVIGRRIKLQPLLDSVPKLVSNLGASAEDAHHAAVGITTTDLVSKSAAIEVSQVFAGGTRCAAHLLLLFWEESAIYSPVPCCCKLHA